MRDQVKRSGGWDIVAEIDFDVVIARQALELTAAEVIERFAVTRAEQARDVVAVVVDCLLDRFRSRDRCETKLRRRYDESLVDEDLSTFGMIDRHQTDVVVVINF